MKFRRRRRKPRPSTHRTNRGYWVRVTVSATLVGVLGLGATLPFGGVSSWAADAILLGALATAVLLLILRPIGGDLRDADALPEPSRRRGSRMILWALPAWALLQILPLPAATVRRLQPGWETLLEGLPSVPGVISLALDRSGSLSALLLWLALAAVAAATAAGFRDRHAARILAHVIVLIGTFQAFAALIIPGMETSWWDTFSNPRLQGTFSGPNTFGGLLVLTVPVTLGLLLSVQNRLLDVIGGRWKRLMALPSRHHLLLIEWVWIFLCLLAQVVTLVGSGSRGATLSTLAPSAVLFAGYVVAAKSDRGKTLMFAGLLLLAFLAIATGGGLILLFDRFQTDMFWDRGVSGRMAIWGAALRLIGAFPLGVGAGAFASIFPKFQPPEFGGFRLDHAHNDYLQWTGEFGIPGLVLLVLILAGLLCRAAGTVNLQGVRHSAWIWRGGAAATVAALMHASVDFNLMARPGVRTMFFIVCGLMLSAPRKTVNAGDASKRKRDPQPCQSSSRTRRIGFALLVTLAVLIGWPSAGRLLTARRVESARVALNLPADPYFWMPPAWIAPDHAMAALAAACERQPSVGRYRYALAIGRLRTYLYDRQAAIEAAMKDDYTGRIVNERHVARMIDLAMQWELRQALAFSLDQLEQAVLLAPWDADMRSSAASVAARLAEREAGTADAEGYRRIVARYIDGAVRLAPYDVRVLVETCGASARLHNAARIAQDTEMTESASRRLVEWGRRAVDIDPGTTGDVMAAWEEAGMLTEQLENIDALPLPILREVYRYFAQQHHAVEAMRVLQQLTDTYAAGTTAASGPDRVFLAREKYRWLIWNGDWPAYRNALKHRRNTWHERQINALSKETAVGSADATRRIHMRAVDRDLGLNVKKLLILSQLEWERGATSEAMILLSRALALGGTGAVAIGEEIEAFKAWRNTVDTDRDHYAERWLECRLLRADAQPRAAALRYTRLLEYPWLPLRFRHRIRLETVAAWMEAGETAAALAEIKQTIRDGLDDPDVLRIWIEHELGETPFRGPDGVITSASERLAALQPALELGVRFMGERIELMGLTIEPYGDVRGAQTRVRTSWRFFDRVPSDLRVRIVVRADDGYAFAQRTSWFSREMSDRFSAGEPRAGNVLTLNTALPPQARAGDRLILTLHAGTRRLSSDDGLLRVEINDWTRLLTVDEKTW